MKVTRITRADGSAAYRVEGRKANPAGKSRTYIYVAVGVAAVAAIGAYLWYSSKQSSASTTNPSSNSSGTVPGPLGGGLTASGGGGPGITFGTSTMPSVSAPYGATGYIGSGPFSSPSTIKPISPPSVPSAIPVPSGPVSPKLINPILVAV